MDNDSSPSIEVTVEADLWHAMVTDLERTCRQTVLQCLAVLCGRPASTLPARWVISVLLTDDDAIRHINRDHRHIDKPTNVLSFPLAEPDEIDQSLADTSRPAQAEPPHDHQTAHDHEAAPLMLGDVILAAQTIEREAGQQNKSLEAHLHHLLVHGILHLFGYDHVDDGDAEIMEQRERDILETMGIADPYCDGAHP